MNPNKKKVRKVESTGVVHIYATFNNTIVTITDNTGACVSWSSAGNAGFKGARKGTPFAASQCAKICAENALKLGVRQVSAWLKGPGPGRDSAIRAVKTAGLKITTIRDVTPLPHNGCRPPKERRV